MCVAAVPLYGDGWKAIALMQAREMTGWLLTAAVAVLQPGTAFARLASGESVQPASGLRAMPFRRLRWGLQFCQLQRGVQRLGEGSAADATVPLPQLIYEDFFSQR